MSKVIRITQELNWIWASSYSNTYGAKMHEKHWAPCTFKCSHQGRFLDRDFVTMVARKLDESFLALVFVGGVLWVVKSHDGKGERPLPFLRVEHMVRPFVLWSFLCWSNCLHVSIFTWWTPQGQNPFLVFSASLASKTYQTLKKYTQGNSLWDETIYNAFDLHRKYIILWNCSDYKSFSLSVNTGPLLTGP